MGLRVFLLFPGLIVMIAFIMMALIAPIGGGGPGSINFLGQGSNNGAAPAVVTCTSYNTPCFPAGGFPANTQIICNTGTGGSPCDLWPSNGNVPPGTSQPPCAFFGLSCPDIIMPDGGSIYVAPNGQVQGQNQATASFSYGSLSPASLIIMVTVAVGVAALGALNFLSSGENAEGTHILFIGGMLLGIWAILSALEGFITGSPTSGFTAMNNAFPAFPLGSALYVILTFLYVIGITGTVSRGV